MKVTKQQAEQNREALLEAAGRLFKQHGIDGIGVADVCREAGLTPGALYKHFADKQDLAAQAFAHAFRQGHERVKSAPAGKPLDIERYLKTYLSRRVRDDPAAGCPLIATACETGRQGEALSERFAEAFTELRDGVAAALPEPGVSGVDREAQATLFVAAFMGAMALSRGVAKADRALADQVLRQVQGALGALGGSAPMHTAA